MSGEESWRPTKEQLREAEGKVVPDIIAPDLSVLFCGINPGLYSAAVRHHFARPGNRFWPTLFAAGFSDRLLRAEQDRKSTRLNSSHSQISYAVFCLKKKKSRQSQINSSLSIAGSH